MGRLGGLKTVEGIKVYVRKRPFPWVKVSPRAEYRPVLSKLPPFADDALLFFFMMGLWVTCCNGAAAAGFKVGTVKDVQSLRKKYSHMKFDLATNYNGELQQVKRRSVCGTRGSTRFCLLRRTHAR